MKQDPTIYKIFVQAKVLRRLNEPPTPPSFEVNALICELLPMLAVPHARKKQLSVIIGFLDHAESTISNAGLIACKKIVDSTLEDRACLHSEFSKLNFAKESSLKLCDYAMPVFCKDWAAADDFAKIARLLTSTEPRIRVPAQRVWNDAIINTPSARAKILCSSQYEDCIVIGYQTLPHMAVEIIKAGTNYARQLVKLLNHPRVELRRAALQSIQVVSESSNANCEILLSVEAFEGLTLALQTNPQDSIDATRKILIRLAPFLSTSSDACARLLQLLDSKDPQVEGATRATLSSIAHTNTEYRETLRNIILDRLVIASDAQIEFTALAIKGWIGPDLAQLNDFETFFGLVSHSNKSIQTAALSSLKQRLSEREYQELLERANIISVLRSLSSSDNPEAISFVAFALPTMALTLAHNNHYGSCDEPQIREGASTAIENIANGSVNDRKHLLDVDILERLIRSYEPLEQTELQLSHPQQHLRVAATRSVTTMVGGAPADRARLRHALLLRLHGPSAPSGALRLSRMLARDMVKDGDLLQLFRLFENGDPRIRAPAITELWSFIQASDETARRRIVDAEVLPAILHAGLRGKDDLIAFTADCVLPILGPSFSQHDGGTSIVPLLDHNEPRIRTAAAMALRGVVDSRYGNIENMVKTEMISKLHASVRAEIDSLFPNIADGREIVRHLFPALLRCLDEPPDYALGIIAQGMCGGLQFVSNGKEAELLYIVEHGNPVLIAPAVSAITELLSKGGESEHRKLMEAEIFHVALAFHQNPSRRDLSLKLLYDIISHLCHAIIIKEGLAEELLDLFDDPDTHLSQVLSQSLAVDPRVLGSSTFPTLLPMLASADKMRNPFVSKLVRHWAPDMVSRLIRVRQVDIILKVYLQEIRNNVIDAREEEKDLLVDELQFVPALGNYLKSRDATLRRISSEIVEILSNGSAFRSGRIMEEGIGSSLAWVAAPDHANQLVSDSLPAVCDILEDFHRSLDVHFSSLRLLTDIAQHSPWHRFIIDSGIIAALVMWLSPQHSITDPKCKQFAFQICSEIAQKSDFGRKALIDDEILPVLLRLATNNIGTNVINACKVLNALAYSGTYRETLIEAGVKKVMEQITSLFHPSTLTNSRDKTKAQDAAKQVLKTFKLTKNSTAGTRDSFTEPNSLRRSLMLPPSRSTSTSLPRSAGMNSPTQETAHHHVRWRASESAADSNAADIEYRRDEVVLDGDRLPRLQNSRSVGHLRRLTDPGYGALRTRPSRLTEGRVTDAPSQVHEDRIRPPGGMNVGVTARASFLREPGPRRTNSPLGENSGRLGAGSEQGSGIPASSFNMARSALGGEARLAGSSEMGTDISPPSYHTMPVPTSARST
ncbi:armadillo-type protein [Amanita rubescens]|nr:armadillo-type protein [Amanita rubescens]